MWLQAKSGGLRWLIVIAVALLAAGVVVIAGNQLLALKERLAGEAVWVRWGWWFLAVAVVVGLAAGCYRLLFPRRRPATPAAAPDEDGLRQAVADWSVRGVDVSVAREELAELDQRRQAGDAVVAVYGEISAGKSSLIRALLPAAEVAVDVRGGTTRAVTHYRWTAPDGRDVVFADVPGLGEAHGAGEGLAADEAARAHIVLFVADGDLSRGQQRALEDLARLDKPLVVAVNKSDRFTPADLERIRERLKSRWPAAVSVVPVRSGGREEIVRRDAQGAEMLVERERFPDVRALRRALQTALDRRGGALERRRDSAVFLLTAGKLEGAVQAHRRDAADALVQRYARRAVVGALAAVAPGSDLVIQGALAVGLVRELCGLYRVDAREVEIDRLIAALRRRTGHVTPLLLGVAGNALKAFPGMGTLAGGLVHAVAYGLLFRSVGAALAESLEQRGELDSDDALRRFEETLREDLEPSARELATTALERSGAGERQHGAGADRR